MELGPSPSESDRLRVRSTNSLRGLRRTAAVGAASSDWGTSSLGGMTMGLDRLVELIQEHSSPQTK